MVEMKKMDEVKQQQDGWNNLLTGLGIEGRDKLVSTVFGAPMIFNEQTLDNLYRGDGFARRVVDSVANEMTREWIQIEGDTDGLTLKVMKKLKTKKMFNKAEKWARLYGGAVIVMRINDGNTLSEPLNMNTIKKIEALKTYSRYQVTVRQRYDNIENSKFGEVELYDITPVHSGGGGSFQVHESRVLIFEGETTSDRQKAINQDWDDSTLQSAYYPLRRLGHVYSSIETIVSFFETGILSVKGLQEMIASGQEGLIKTRIEIFNLTKAVVNMILLDEGETFEKKSSSVQGLPQIVDKFAQALSASTGIPTTILMGQSPAGLQATGASDIRNWYDKIHSQQEDKFYDGLVYLTEIIMLSKTGPFKGKELDSWDVVFVPLWQMTEEEKANIKKTQSETDKVYIENDVVSSDEIRESRFGGEVYSTETTIDENTVINSEIGEQ